VKVLVAVMVRGGKNMKDKLLRRGIGIVILLMVLIPLIAYVLGMPLIYSVYLIVILFGILWLMCSIWVFEDARKRNESRWLWFLIVLIVGILGLIIWLIVRPKIGSEKTKNQITLCPNCGKVIPNDARVCSYCAKEFW